MNASNSRLSVISSKVLQNSQPVHLRNIPTIQLVSSTCFSYVVTLLRIPSASRLHLMVVLYTMCSYPMEVCLRNFVSQLHRLSLSRFYFSSAQIGNMYRPTRHNRFANRLANRLDNRLHHVKKTFDCWTNGSSNSCNPMSKRLDDRCKWAEFRRPFNVSILLTSSIWHQHRRWRVWGRRQKLRGLSTFLEITECCGEWATLIIINLGHGTRHWRMSHTNYSERQAYLYMYFTIGL
jgi:hypothetical protein